MFHNILATLLTKQANLNYLFLIDVSNTEISKSSSNYSNLYSVPSKKSTQDRSQPNFGQTTWSYDQRYVEQCGPLAADASQPEDHSKLSDQPSEKARRCRITVRLRGTSNSA